MTLNYTEAGCSMEKVDFHIGIMDDYQGWIDKMRANLVLLSDLKKFVNLNFIYHDFLSGADFFESEKSKKCQLLLLDYKMPEMDGLEVAREIEKRGANTKIIFMSDLADLERVAMQTNAIGPVIGFFKKSDPSNGILHEVRNGINRILDVRFMKIEHYKREKNTNEKISQSSIIDTKRIEIIEVNQKEITLCLIDGTELLTTKPLSAWLKELPEGDFAQVSKNFAVNFRYVRGFNKRKIRLTNADDVELGRGYRKKEFEEKRISYLLRKAED